jgi:hypothetical protein
MKSLAVVGFLILSSALSAQDAMLAGIILPVQLNSSLKSNRAEAMRSPVSAPTPVAHPLLTSSHVLIALSHSLAIL